jgi:hypothetical protein
MDKDKVITWMEAALKLAAAKTHEMELRQDICKEVLDGKLKGVKHLIVEGLDVAATGKINTTLDPELLESIWNDLPQQERDCVVQKPSLVAKNYKGLSDDSLLHQAVTTKPGAPSLSVKPVKE